MTYGMTRAGSTEPIYQAPSDLAKSAAEAYVDEVAASGCGGPKDWKAVCKKGGPLLDSAGSVEGAAMSLWQVREDRGLNNLKGVEHPYLDTVLHPDLLAYLRDVRERGLAARCPGPIGSGVGRSCTPTRGDMLTNCIGRSGKMWPSNVSWWSLLLISFCRELWQALSMLWTRCCLTGPLRWTSGWIHDQRGVNALTDKEWRPPAVQPKHVQIARLIMWHKCHCPGVEVLLSKKDIAGAFRLLWVDPRDVALFAGELPWLWMEMEHGEDVEGEDVTVIYLVSSFGFSGSPGEWAVWGRATEDFLTSHRPANTRQDLSATFTSRILVDDNVLVEPYVGLRPWVAAEVYEKGVKTMLGEHAVDTDKDSVEGLFRTFQTVWGLDVETETEAVHLPERRIMKGRTPERPVL